jgi:poly [ADP-ribose] polymerase
MYWDGSSSTFSVEYGRVNSTHQTGNYNISLWDSKYKEKIKKGYKDVTPKVSLNITSDKKITDPSLLFIQKMLKYSSGIVSKTYAVSGSSISQDQIDEAQKILDKISKTKGEKKVNDLLVELYMCIPRYMSHVNNHLLPNINLSKTIIQEQENIDALSGQFGSSGSSFEEFCKSLNYKLVKSKDTSILSHITKQLPKSKIIEIYDVEKKEELDQFDNWLKLQDNRRTKILVHGTRCSSVLSILKQGLKIRPSGNYQFSGKAYGEGNYFSEVVNKSLNYTGYDNDQILLVYEVHTGNPFVYNGWFTGNSFPLNYKELSKRKYGSTFVKAGNGLLNSEIIVYKECQSRIKSVIHLKR